MIEYLLPTKVVAGENIENVESLFYSKGLYATINSNANEWNQHLKMNGAGAFVVLDFGKEMNGGVRLITNLVQDVRCKLRIRFGESLGEVNAELGEKNAQNAHSLRDFETTVCAHADVTHGQTGFRFVRIDLLENQLVYFKNIFCENHIFSQPPIYVYRGADQRISDIFEASERAADLLIPYLLWVTFAGYLNFGIFLLN